MIHSYFYPRSPCGERLAEVDGEDTSSGDFYPRSPCGERRPASRRDGANGADFYPRSPCGERLYANFDGFYWWVISIHALLAESDLFLCCNAAKPRHFYPRSPCGERPGIAETAKTSIGFLSTLSLRRATRPKHED